MKGRPSPHGARVRGGVLAGLVLALAVAIAWQVDPPSGVAVLIVQVLGRPSFFALTALWLGVPLVIAVGWWLALHALARPLRAAVVGTVVIYVVAAAASFLALLIGTSAAGIGLGAVGFALYGALLVLVGLLAYLPFILGGALVWAGVMAWLGRHHLVAGADASAGRGHPVDLVWAPRRALGNRAGGDALSDRRAPEAAARPELTSGLDWTDVSACCRRRAALAWLGSRQSVADATAPSSRNSGSSVT